MGPFCDAAYKTCNTPNPIISAGEHTHTHKHNLILSAGLYEPRSSPLRPYFLPGYDDVYELCLDHTELMSEMKSCAFQ